MTHILSTTTRATALRLLGVGLVAAFAITACGGDDGDESDDEVAPDPQTEQSDDGSSPSPEPGGEPGDAADGEVPDPCSLISQAELTSLLGTDPGAGQSDAMMPDQRKVCFFQETDAVLTLGIELASHYEIAVSKFEGSPQDVEGVGREAVWFEMGTAGTLIAVGEDFFVDVTVGADQQDAAKAIAEAMLAAV